jgi:hypothetical protein
MSKVIQGMVRAGLSEIPDKKMLVFLMDSWNESSI